MHVWAQHVGTVYHTGVLNGGFGGVALDLVAYVIIIWFAIRTVFFQICTIWQCNVY